MRSRTAANRQVRYHPPRPCTLWVAHTTRYGYDGSMKTTVEIQPALLERAKRHAQRVGKPLRAIIEEGLRRVLEEAGAERPRYRMPDRAMGQPGVPNPLESLSWQDLRDEIYGARR
jgi:hypothetical protein